VLKRIEIIGDAVGGGGFADIFKGRLLDQAIAVKVLRVYQKSDMEKLLKVTLKYAIFVHVNLGPFPGILVRSCHVATTTSMAFINSTETHQGFALCVPGWKTGTWYDSWLIGLLIPIAFLWYVTNWRPGTVYIMNGFHSHLTLHWVWSICMARVLSTEILKRCVFSCH